MGCNEDLGGSCCSNWEQGRSERRAGLTWTFVRSGATPSSALSRGQSPDKLSRAVYH